MQQKSKYPYFAILCSFLLLTSCLATRNSTTTEPSTAPHERVMVVPIEDNSPQNWGNIFRSVPGIQVNGSYPNLSLTIRGATSLTQTNDPLYVLEGVPLGHDFNSLANAVNPLDIKSIRVLSGAEAAIYGSRGGNGVIIVELKD